VSAFDEYGTSPKSRGSGRPPGGPAPDRRPHARNGSRPQRSHKKDSSVSLHRCP
jgi:hypothetical protein